MSPMRLGDEKTLASVLSFFSLSPSVSISIPFYF